MKPILLALALAVPVTAAPLTLANSDFQASGNNTDPAGWSVTENNAGNVSSVYVWGSISNVLAFWGAGATVQQSFPSSEITADSQGFFNITFDSGWRGCNIPTATGFQVEFALVNVTDGTTLGTATYQFPPPASAITNTHTVIGTGNRVSISYDSTQASLAGDTVALRITATGSPNQGGNNFLNTGWLDNISVTAGERSPAAHWSFDSPERLEESYGRGSLNLAQAGGTSAWSTRSNFGDVLANGFNAPYLSATNQSALQPGAGDFSLSLWSLRTSDNATAAGLLDALSVSAGAGWQLFYQANGTLRMRLDDTLGNTINADTTSSQLTLNNWRNLIVTVDRTANRARFYINGTEAAPVGGVNVSAITGSIIPDQNLHIGTLNETNPSRGQIDDVAIFNRVLTPGEISAISSNNGTPVLTLFPSPVPVPAVIASPESGSILRSGDTVSLTSEPGTMIHYTLDGSDPTASSPVYSTPFFPLQTTMVKARVIAGNRSGAITSATYLRIPETPPNVVLIVGDDIGFNDPGCYGAVSAVTPRLDAFSDQGQRFTQFTTTGPGDAASQFALLTGRLACRGNLPATVPPGSVGIDTREWTLAESFRKAGYHTAFIGAWHLGAHPGSRPTDQGFVTFHGWPWSPDQIPAPALEENGIPVTPVPIHPLDAITTRAENEIAPHASQPFFLVFQPPSLPTSGTSLLGSYGNWIEAIDTSVGRILDQLTASNAVNHTLVVFLSDGGANKNVSSPPSGSNGQMRDGKGSTWEGGVRAPLIARWTGVIPAGDNHSVLWLPDLQRTLVDLVDGYQPADRPLDGSSRPDVLLGVRTRPDDTTTLFLHRHTGAGYAPQVVRVGKWKLHTSAINTDPDNKASTTTPLLFDLLVDPTEHVNRASTETNVVSSLQQTMAAHEATFSMPFPQLPVARGPILGPVHSSTAQLAETTATFTFTRPKDALNDHYIVQTGSDLTGWTDIATSPHITVEPGSTADTEDIRITLPLETLGAGSPRFFVRLKATRP